MRIKHCGTVKIWLSARDTYNWGAAWPCSQLSGRRLFAEFDRDGNLIDLALDGGRGGQDCPADEFNAITSDYLAQREDRPQ